jgi:hypothetical protein
MANETGAFERAVAAEVEAWRAALATSTDVVYPNGPVLQENQISSPWVDLSVRYYGAQPMTVGPRAPGRHSGAIALAVFTRRGEGSAEANGLVDSLIELTRGRRLGGAVLEFPQRMTPTEIKGWEKVGILVPFKLDSV